MAVGEILDNKGLQGLWHLNGNWSDFSSNGYALTPTNTPIGTKGKFGSAFQFSSASSQYATIAAASAPNLEITGVQTGICWFNPTTSNSFQELFGKNNEHRQDECRQPHVHCPYHGYAILPGVWLVERSHRT